MIKNKHLRSLVVLLTVIAIIAAAFSVAVFIEKKNNTAKTELTVEEAQTIVDREISALPNNIAPCAKYVAENTKVTVNEIEYGYEKNIILKCTYDTVDIFTPVKENVNELLNVDLIDPVTKKTKNATAILLEIKPRLLALMENSERLSGEVEIVLYETKDKGLTLYLDDAMVDKVLGGIISAKNFVNSTKEITVDGETIDISNRSSLRSGCIDCFKLKNYSSEKPDTSSVILGAYNNFKTQLYRNFIEDNRYMYLVRGLGTTLSITLLSLLLGLVIGFVVAIIRCTYQKTGKLKILDYVTRLYVSIMRGTPVMIQLMIIYFVILLPIGIEKFTAAVLCFGINSGAYVSEIVRGGIMSIDDGQLEAGRSLGFNYVATMWYIIIPQAIKAVLPALANEFIALLKETSVAFYIGVADLTQGGLKIRSITYSNFMPLIAIAVVYLVLVLGLSYLVSLLERRLRKSDRG